MRPSRAALAVILLTHAVGCYRPILVQPSQPAPQPTVYKRWGDQLLSLGGHARVDHVSQLLGVPATCTETPFEDPNGGFFVYLEEPRIMFVVPDGPAAEIGLEVGTVILQVAGVPVTTGASSVAVFRREAEVGVPVRLTTSRGDFDLVPTPPSTAELQQCYWQVDGGRIVTSQGAYDRFFRASCQVARGWLVSCSSNHQF